VNVRHNQAFELLKICARLEFALKSLPEFLLVGPDGVPAVNWSGFQKVVRLSVADMVQAEHRDILLGGLGLDPPRRMLVEQGKVVFRNAELSGPLGDRLIISSRRVRNNLVHGGKETQQQERYRGHDEALVIAATSVLSIAAGVYDPVATLCYDGRLA
jgi:hypothetical protein